MIELEIKMLTDIIKSQNSMLVRLKTFNRDKQDGLEIIATNNDVNIDQ
jgi:hypothetical protein